MSAARHGRIGGPVGVALIALLCVGAEAPAARTALVAPPVAELVRVVLRPGSRLWIEGDSNVHDWKCEAGSFTPALRLDRASADQPSTRVEEATLEVPVAKLEGGHGLMNTNLRKALHSNDHPNITFVVTGAQLSRTRTRGARSTWWRSATCAIKMTDFGILPPTAMMGVLKTKDDVTILFDLKAEYAPLEEATS
jgi:hypothetical protein